MADPALDPQLESFFEQHVQPRLPVLGALRRKARLGALAVIALPIAGMIGGANLGFPNGAIVATGVVMFIAIGIGAAVLYTRFLAAYKAEVVGPLMKRLDPAAVYEPDGKIPESQVTAAGLLPEASDCSSEDVVRGQSSGTAFEFANVTLKKKEGKNTKTVFSGLFYQAADSRERQGTTVVIPAGNDPTIPDVDDPHEVKLVAPGAADRFDAYTTHPEEAARLLTPSVIAALVRLSEKLDTDVFASFSPGKVSLAANVGDFFEPGFLRPLVTRGDVAQIATLFSSVRTLVQDFGMPGDAHFAHAFVPTGDEDEDEADDDELDDEDETESEEPSAVSPAGVTTPSHTFGAGFAGAPASQPFGMPLADAPSLQPFVERLRSAGYGVTLLGQSSLTLEFGTSGRMWRSLVIAILWGLVGLAVLDRATGWPSDGTLVQPLVDAVPMAGVAVAWLVRYHPATTALAILFALLGIRGAQRNYPRRVVLTPQTVERVGGLLPGARTRPLEPGGSVTTAGGVVRVRSSGILGVAVSPPLSAEAAETLSKLVAGFRGVRVS
jgi:hypothetical protein